MPNTKYRGEFIDTFIYDMKHHNTPICNIEYDDGIPIIFKVDYIYSFSNNYFLSGVRFQAHQCNVETIQLDDSITVIHVNNLIDIRIFGNINSPHPEFGEIIFNRAETNF